ncbi:hypothetical protein C1H46_045478 [Malus baccata]|uniref:Uncharacterized protein n=1 Tax=Malus baccata TaxID=106549 RepID=A0A540K432_MALBA|nr:hypothetical protein C1H46_045478 [Malus baccata]
MYSSASNSLHTTSNLNFTASSPCNGQTPHFSSITRNRLAGIIERGEVNRRSSDKLIKISGAFRSLFKFKAIIPHMYMMWIDIILTFITWKFVRTTVFVEKLNLTPKLESICRWNATTMKKRGFETCSKPIAMKLDFYGRSLILIAEPI